MKHNQPFNRTAGAGLLELHHMGGRLNQRLAFIMGIDVQLRDEQGNVLEEVSDENFVLSRAVTRGVFTGSNLLRYLVPWGDAIFNQAQAGDLYSDTTAFFSKVENEKVSEHIRKLQPLIERLANETRSYLWFIGD